LGKATSVILSIIVSSIFAVGISNVYGEEQFYYEPKFKFPVPNGNNIDNIINKCGLQYITDVEMHVQCDFILKFGEDGMGWYLELKENIGLDISQEEKQRKDLGIEQIKEEEPPKTPYDTDLEKLEEKIANPDIELTATEKEYYELITQYAECQRGLDQARGIQEESTFRVGAIQMDNPEWAPENIERGQSHSKLAMAVQECLAQRIHLLPALGDYRAEGDVQSRQSWFGQTQKYHAEFADKVPQWSISRAEAEANKDFTQQTPHEILCNSDRVTKKYKQDQGCEEYLININCPSCNIEYQSTAMDKWNQYKADGGASMFEEIKRQVISDKINQFLKYQ